jgi:hypothetical protein
LANNQNCSKIVHCLLRQSYAIQKRPVAGQANACALPDPCLHQPNSLLQNHDYGYTAALTGRQQGMFVADNCRRLQAYGTGFPWEKDVRNGYCNTSDTSALELRFHSQPNANQWCWRFLLMNDYTSASVAEVTAVISGQDGITYSKVVAVGLEIGKKGI